MIFDYIHYSLNSDIWHGGQIWIFIFWPLPCKFALFLHVFNLQIEQAAGLKGYDVIKCHNQIEMLMMIAIRCNADTQLGWLGTWMLPAVAEIKIIHKKMLCSMYYPFHSIKLTHKWYLSRCQVAHKLAKFHQYRLKSSLLIIFTYRLSFILLDMTWAEIKMIFHRDSKGLW